MISGFEEFIDGLAELRDVEAVWQATADLAYGAGFSSCSLTLGQKTSQQNPRKNLVDISPRYYMTDLSEDFKTAYLKGGLFEIDPFLRFGCTSLTTRKIMRQDMLNFPDNSSKYKLFEEHLREDSVTGCVSIPTRTNNSDIFGGWVFAHNEMEDRFDLLMEDCGRDMHLASVLAYERMVALGLEKNGHETEPAARCEYHLSARERECLLWLCAGLRVSRIAHKLSISNSAVNLYIGNAKYKLGAQTREQAIALAILSGEIEP